MIVFKEYKRSWESSKNRYLKTLFKESLTLNFSEDINKFCRGAVAKSRRIVLYNYFCLCALMVFDLLGHLGGARIVKNEKGSVKIVISYKIS